jgi:hypothetical protein
MNPQINVPARWRWPLGWFHDSRPVARWWPSSRALLVCLLVCVVAPLSLVAVHVYRSPSFSIIDEQTHLDYVQHVADGSLPRLGQRLLPSTDYLLRCVARPPWVFSVPPFSIPPCRHATRSLLNRFFHSVHNAQYEAQQPPLYYAATAVFRWPLIHILGLGALPGTRLTGAIWLAAGLLLMWVAGMILGLDWRMVAAGALFVAAAPNVVFAAASVGNDAAAIFAGALVAALGAAAWRMPGKVPWWVFALTGTVVALLKVSSVLAVLPVSALLLAAAWPPQRNRADRSTSCSLRRALATWLPTGGAMLAGAFVGVVAWSVAFQVLALANPSNFKPFRLDTDGHTGILDLGHQALTMLFPFTNLALVDFQWTAAGVVHTTVGLARIQKLNAYIVSALLLTAGFAWLIPGRRTWAQWLGVTSMLTLFFGGWALGISILLTYGFNTSLPGRYGLSIAVLLTLALIGVLEGRSGRLLLSAVAGGTFMLTFAYILV